MSCVANKAARVNSFRIFKENDVEQMNDIPLVLSTTSRGLIIKALDLNTIHIFVYGNTFHATYHDLSSQLEWLILLADDSNTSHVLAHS